VRKLIVISIFNFSSWVTGSCQLIISANTGQGSYSMGDMKSLQNQIASAYPVIPHTGPSFPSYWFYDVNLKQRFKNNFLFGASFSSGSTGGRVYYSDYSGEIGSEQMLSFQSYQLTLGFQKRFFGGHLILEGDLRPGITATDLNWKSYINVGTYSEDTKEFKSQNFVVQPTFTVGGRFGIIGVQGFTGYNLTVVSGQLNEVGNPNYLTINNQKLHADWSGLRMGAGLSLYLNEAENAKDNVEDKSWKTAAGLGLGLDYGGIGINVLTYPGNHIGMFGGVGYALAGVGYNAGVKIRTKSIASPETSMYFLGMYGYNAAISITNNDNFNRFFYGPTFGIGVDFRQRSNGFWSLGLFLPIRSDEVNQYINSLSSAGVKTTSLTPVTISVGYRFQSRE
jgi:hypothetical protein